MTDPIARMEAALAELGADQQPPWGWEARVLAATGQRPRWRRWQSALQVVSLAAIALIFLAQPRSSNDNLALDVSVRPAGPVVRGSFAHVGDRVHVTATRGDRHGAIWVYRNDRELVVACPDGPSCGRSGDTMTADVTLQAIGSYTFMAVTSTSPLPAPQGTYDADRAAAQEAGAKAESHVLDVR